MRVFTNPLFRRLAFVVVTGLGIVSIIPTIVFRYKIDVNPFWDTEVYIRAINTAESYGSPYDFDDSVPVLLAKYAYHPYVLQTTVILNRLFPIQLWFCFFFIFSLLFFVRELYLTYGVSSPDNVAKRSKIKFVGFLLLVGFIGSSPLIAIASGNVALFLHFFLIALSLRSIRLEKSLAALSIFCALAAVVKPYYLAYLAIVLFYSTTKRRGLALVATSLLLFISIYFSAAYLVSSSFSSYLEAVRYTTSGVQDWGFSFYGILRRRLGDELAIFSHLAILTSVIAFPSYLKFRLNFASSELLWCFPLIMYFIICLNPRMKEYDFGTLIFVALSAIYLLNRRFAYLAIVACSTLFLVRWVLLWLNMNLISAIPDNILYLKYWEVLIAASLVFTSTKMSLVKRSSKSNIRGT